MYIVPFLSMDHSFGHGRPLLYETMIFGGPHHGEQWRYSTRSEAVEGHAAALALVLVERAKGGQ